MSLNHSLRIGNHVCAQILRALATWLLLFTLMRVVVYMNSPLHFFGSVGTDVIWAVVIGLRFDVLVLAFLTLPVMALVLVLQWRRQWPASALRAVGAYYSLAWVLMMALSFADLLFFSREGRHLTTVDWSTQWEVMAASWQTWELNARILNSGLYLGLLIVGAREFWTLPLGEAVTRETQSSLEPAWKLAVRWLGPVVLLGIAARGNLGAHHLRREDAFISSHRVVNQLVVGSIWPWNKRPLDE